MNGLGFTKLSLRDLSVLVHLVEEGRIAPVARRFSMSSSAVSYTVERLRSALQDPLLIRTSHGFRPTAPGRDYAARAAEFLAEMDAVQGARSFDPARSQRLFKLVATDYELGSFLGGVLCTLRNSAPLASVQIFETRSNFDAHRLFEEIDCVFVPMAIARAGVVQERLFADDYVSFYDPDIRDAPKGLDEFCAAPHGVVGDDAQLLSNVDKALSKQARSRQIQLSVPSFAALASTMKGTNLITTLPSQLASDSFSGFAQASPAVDLEPMEVFLTYAETRKEDSGFQWLRGLIIAGAAEACRFCQEG